MSQRQYLEDMRRARRSTGALTSRLFLRPRRKLPVGCESTVSRVDSRADALRWSFRLDGEAAGDGEGGGAALTAAWEAGERAAHRIARDLHDEAGQLLAALHLAIEDTGRDLPDPARTRVLSMRDLVRSVEEQLRLLSREMRSPALEDLGLAAALESLGSGIEARAGTKVAVKALYRGRMDPTAETHLYRIAQESISNAVRHGRPARIVVRLQKFGGKVLLSVADDGAGFDVPAALAARHGRGIGLKGIHERVDALEGTLSVESTPGKGTTVTVTAPLCL